MREKDTLVKRVSFFIFPNFFARGNSFSNYKYENLLRGEGARIFFYHKKYVIFFTGFYVSMVE